MFDTSSPARPVIPGPACSAPPARLRSDEPVLALQRAEREAARAFLAQGAALLALWDSTPDDTRAGRRAHALAEAGLALGLHPLTVEARYEVARRLRALPLVTGLLRDGRLGVPHALTALDETSALPPELAEKVLTAVLAGSGRLGWDSTPGSLRTTLRRTAIRLDPAGSARRRAEAAAARTGARLRHRADGLADWTFTGPGLALVTADRLLDALSGPDGPDDTRPRGRCQLDALLGALAARASAPVPVELQVHVPVGVRSGPPEPVVLAAELTSELAELLAASTADAGTPPGTSRPGPGEPGPVAGAPSAVPGSGEPGPPRRRAPRDGVPELVGSGPVDPVLLSDLLGNAAGLPLGLGPVRLRRLLTDRHGQVLAVDARAGAVPLGPPGEVLRRLTADLPAPPPAIDRYRPTAAQASVVRARDPRCCFPGCPRPSARCDLDHRRPYPAGPTDVGNLHPLCRHHHQLKQDGFAPTRARDGTTTWTTPRGQTRRTVPA